MGYGFIELTPEIIKLAEKSMEGYKISPELYTKYDVKRGLRDINGNGVVAGLTNISTIRVDEEGHGKLFYRGIDVEDIVAGFIKEKRYGFEETIYLLLFGNMPTETELAEFKGILSGTRNLPPTFTRDVIMKAPSDNMMNTLAKCVLSLYSYDQTANDISIPNVLRQSISLITLFPVLAIYGYHAYKYTRDGGSLFIHDPDPQLSIAENLLYMLRPDKKYTELESRILDLALVLHAEHGGGNNSTFTVHVVSSSGTDTYSAIAAALGSLKGPKHGGANIKVAMMFDDMKQNVKDWTDEEEVRTYLKSFSTKKLSTTPDLSMEWDMPFTPTQTRERLFSKALWKNSVPKKAGTMNLIFTRWLNGSHPKSLPKKDEFTKACVQTWIFTADLYTVCWVFPMSCLLRFLRFRVLQAGLLTV